MSFTITEYLMNMGISSVIGSVPDVPIPITKTRIGNIMSPNMTFVIYTDTDTSNFFAINHNNNDRVQLYTLERIPHDIMSLEIVYDAEYDLVILPIGHKYIIAHPRNLVFGIDSINIGGTFFFNGVVVPEIVLDQINNAV